MSEFTDKKEMKKKDDKEDEEDEFAGLPSVALEAKQWLEDARGTWRSLPEKVEAVYKHSGHKSVAS